MTDADIHGGEKSPKGTTKEAKQHRGDEDEDVGRCGGVNGEENGVRGAEPSEWVLTVRINLPILPIS